MSDPNLRTTLLHLLGDDQTLYRRLCETGLIPEREDTLLPEHLEVARVVHTLVTELEVNWPGVEIVLRMRTEQLAMRRQVAELLRALGRR